MVWRNDQVSERETEKILEVARQCLTLEGDFVEMGCYRGDTSILLAEILREAQNGRYREKGTSENDFDDKNKNKVSGEKMKKLWLYDSFEGLPEKGEADESAAGVEFQKGALAASKRELKARFLRSGLPVPKIVKGWFNELMSEDLPERIAFAFLDGDLYESIRDCLQLVGPKMASGGMILVHDYQNPKLPGVTKAVEDWGGGEVARFESLAIMKME